MARTTTGRTGRKLRDILDLNYPVLMIDGPPLSGVTRTMFELAQESYGEAGLIRASPVELVRLVRSNEIASLPLSARHLVWLDDLAPADLLLLDTEILTRLTRRATVLASIRTCWRERLLADTTPITADARRTLTKVARSVSVPFGMPADMRRRAQQAYPDVALGVSIAETMVGGDRVLAHYDHCAAHDPDARSLVESAVDLRRAGVHRKLAEHELRKVFNHVRGVRPHRSRRAFRGLLERASTPPKEASVAMIIDRSAAHADGEYYVLPYLAGADDGDHNRPVRPITEHTWSALLDTLPATDAFHLAIGAHLRGETTVAIRALMRAADSSDDVIASVATRVLELAVPQRQ